MKRVAGAVIAALALGCSACGVETQHHAQVAPDDAVPFALLQPDAPPLVTTTTAVAQETVGLCFVRGDKVVTVPVALQPDPRLDQVLAALSELPPGAPRTLHTALSGQSVVRSVRLTSGIARVDLAADFSNLGSDDQLLAIAQIVCSLTLRPGVGQVAFTLAGKPIAVPRGGGSLTNEPVSRDDYRRLLG